MHKGRKVDTGGMKRKLATHYIEQEQKKANKMCRFLHKDKNDKCTRGRYCEVESDNESRCISI